MKPLCDGHQYCNKMSGSRRPMVKNSKIETAKKSNVSKSDGKIRLWKVYCLKTWWLNFHLKNPLAKKVWWQLYYIKNIRRKVTEKKIRKIWPQKLSITSLTEKILLKSLTTKNLTAARSSSEAVWLKKINYRKLHCKNSGDNSFIYRKEDGN